MTGSHTPGDRRPQHVALGGLIIQTAAFALLLGLALWAESRMLVGLSRFFVIGLPIWAVLYLVLNQIRRVELESLETEELERAREAGTSGAIFEVDEESLLLERNRLRWMVRWILPGCTVAVSFLLIVGHFLFWGWNLDQVFSGDIAFHTRSSTMIMWFVICVGFACFLYGRYALAMGRLPRWGLLRAGAVAMAGSAVACVIAAVALMATSTIEWAEPVAAYVIRLAMLLLGIEFAINFILDMYRPRQPGEVPRPSFDSRLLGMVAEPGDIAKSIADAINYQFGFQVSSTWFYQLLQRWLVPVSVVAFLVILLLTSIVVVDADERAIVERWGRPLVGEGVELAGQRDEPNEQPKAEEDPEAILGPGLHMKTPFPRDVVRRAAVNRIQELVIGEAMGGDEHGHDEKRAIVWTEGHEELPHLMLLVATPRRGGERVKLEIPVPTEGGGTESEAVAVSLLMVSVPIEYRIKSLWDYLYNYSEPDKVLEAVAYRYLSDYAASVDIDELMGPGRERFNREFRRNLQARLDDLETGIEIVFAGIRAAHPPAQKNVAAAFERVIAAETEKSATIYAAEGEAQRRLTAVSGSVARATALDEAIRLRDSLPKGTPAHAEAAATVQRLLVGAPEAGVEPVAGRAAETIADARGRASRMTSDAASKVRNFGTHVAAFLAAPDLYRQRQILDLYTGLDYVRKYLVVGDGSNVIIEYETAKEAGLDEVLSEGVGQERQRQGGN